MPTKAVLSDDQLTHVRDATEQVLERTGTLAGTLVNGFESPLRHDVRENLRRFFHDRTR